MANLFEGSFIGRAINVSVGKNKGKIQIKFDMVIIDDGPYKGRTASYSGKLDDASIKWTKRDMLALGWAGLDLRTLKADVDRAGIAMPFEAVVARYKRDDGTVSEWVVARLKGGSAPLGELDELDAAKANEWFRKADAIEPVKHQSGAAYSVPDEDLPF